MRGFVAGVLTAISCALAPLAQSALAQSALGQSAVPQDRPRSFHGDCSFTGVVRFTPPLTTSPRPGRGTATATGTCTGTLSAQRKTRHVDSVPARYWAGDWSPQMDCQGGQATGSGWLRIGDTTVPFRLTEIRAGAVAFLQITGRTWSAVATAHADASTDPVAVVEACAGSGLATTGLDIDLHA